MCKLPLELEFGLKGKKFRNEFEIRFKTLSMKNFDLEQEVNTYVHETGFGTRAEATRKNFQRAGIPADYR